MNLSLEEDSINKISLQLRGIADWGGEWSLSKRSKVLTLLWDINLPKGRRHCHYQKSQACIDDMIDFAWLAG